jgi:hypothetical protein
VTRYILLVLFGAILLWLSRFAVVERRHNTNDRVVRGILWVALFGGWVFWLLALALALVLSLAGY